VIKSEITQINDSEITQLMPLPVLAHTILPSTIGYSMRSKFLKETFFIKQNMFQTVARFYNEQI